MLGSEESQDVGSSEESKGNNLESPKQSNSKMKLKSRLSGKWKAFLLVEKETGLQPWEQGREGRHGEGGDDPINSINRQGREQWVLCSDWPSACCDSQAGLNHSPPASSSAEG